MQACQGSQGSQGSLASQGSLGSLGSQGSQGSQESQASAAAVQEALALHSHPRRGHCKTCKKNCGEHYLLAHYENSIHNFLCFY